MHWMGTEPDATPESDLATLQERLDTEAVTFVDTVNDELATLIEDADHLGFDYLVGDVSDCGPSSNGHLHFNLVYNGSSIHCVCFQFRVSRLDADLEDGLQVAVKGDLSYYEDRGSVYVIVKDVLTSVSLFGGAIPNDSVGVDGQYGSAIATMDGPVVNCHSRNDRVLGWVYRASDGTRAVGHGGLAETASTPAGYTDLDVTEMVADHYSCFQAEEGCLPRLVGRIGIEQ